MNLRRHIARLLSWWRSEHPDRTLEHALPAYAEAVRRERRARARNDSRGIGRASKAKCEALHAALAGKAVR